MTRQFAYAFHDGHYEIVEVFEEKAAEVIAAVPSHLEQDANLITRALNRFAEIEPTLAEELVA